MPICDDCGHEAATQGGLTLHRMDHAEPLPAPGGVVVATRTHTETLAAPVAPARPRRSLGGRLAKIGAGLIAAVVAVGVVGTMVDDKSAEQRVEEYLTGEGQREFFASDGQFRASFPSVPERQTKTQDVAGTSLTLTLYLSGSDDHAFSVGWFDLPPGTPYDLDLGVNGAAAALGGRVEGSVRTTVQGHPAAEFVLSGPDGIFVKGALVHHPARVYVIQVGGVANPPAGYDRFLQSFQIAE